MDDYDRGAALYRYKNYYFGTYDPSLPDPGELGEQVLEEARIGLQACEQRLEEKFLHIDELMKREKERRSPNSGQYYESDEPWDFVSESPRGPYGQYDAEWIFTIDLDRGIFHINDTPFFSLNNLPPSRLALQALIGEDSYGKLACLDEKYRFCTIQPPVLEDAAVQLYRQLLRDGNNAVSYIEMLGLSKHLTQGEEVRLHLLQMIVAHFMTLRDNTIWRFELAANKDEITGTMWDHAISIANIAFAPPLFYSQNSPRRPAFLCKRQDLCWVRSDTLIHITPHLTDDKHTQAAISRVVEEVMRRDKAGTIYGVLFSFFHCIIVKIDKDAGASFIHTPPLEFIPSWFAKEPSTPGMTALTRLGYRLDSELFLGPLPFCSATGYLGDSGPGSSKFLLKPSQFYGLEMKREKVADETMYHPEDPDPYPKAPKGCGDQDHIAPSGRIPAEIWLHIATFLPSVDSVLRFGLVAKALQKAALTILRNPHIDNWRLLKVENCTESSQLVTAKFVAVQDDHYKMLYLGDAFFRRSHSVRRIPLFPSIFNPEFWGSDGVGFDIENGDSGEGEFHKANQVAI